MKDDHSNLNPQPPKQPGAGCRVEIGSRVLIQHQGIWTPGVVLVLFDKTCMVEVRNEHGNADLVEFSYSLGLYAEASPVQAHGLKIKGRLVMPGEPGTTQTSLITEHPNGGPDLVHQISGGKYRVFTLTPPTDQKGI